MKSLLASAVLVLPLLAQAPQVTRAIPVAESGEVAFPSGYPRYVQGYRPEGIYGMTAYGSAGPIYNGFALGVGTRVRLIYRGPAQFPRWSPDGRKLAFISRLGADEKQLEVSIVDANGRNKRVVFRYAGGQFAGLGALSWFPDSSRLLVPFRFEKTQVLHLFVADVHGASDVTPPGWGPHFGSPRLSPDGTRLLYNREYPAVAPSQWGLWISDLRGSNAVRVTQSAHDQYPDWSYDGKRIVFTRDSDVWVVNTDGSALRKLTNSCCGAIELDRPSFPTVSPDGKRVVFIDYFYGSRIWSVPISGGKLTLLLDPKDPEEDGVGPPSIQPLVMSLPTIKPPTPAATTSQIRAAPTPMEPRRKPVPLFPLVAATGFATIAVLLVRLLARSRRG